MNTNQLDQFDCQSCNQCVEVCPHGAMVAYTPEVATIWLQKAVRTDNAITIKPDAVFKLQSAVQYLNLAHLCQQCGKCATVCPHPNGAPYRDKPVVFAAIPDLNKAGEGFYVSHPASGRKVLISKEKGGIRTLEHTATHWLFETDHVTAWFGLSKFDLLKAEFKVPCVQEAHFTKAAEMRVLYTSLP